MKVFHAAIILAAAVCPAGCADKAPEAPAPVPADELPAYRQAAYSAGRYIILEDSAYRLGITRSEAVALGIEEKYYDRITQELAYTNYLISESNRNGTYVELSDVGRIYREMPSNHENKPQ